MAEPLVIRPLAGALGAEVRGLVTGPPSPATADALRQALDSHLMLAIPGLAPNLDDFVSLGQIFGDLEVHPFLPKADESVPEVCALDSEDAPKADVWHTDVTFSEAPPTAALLHMTECPTFGGDTMWINTQAVYETLSEPMKSMLEGLTCIHGDGGQGGKKAQHPVVRVDPVTGRKGLFVNKQFSRRIPELSRPESQMLLAHLFRWQEQVRFSCRWHWSKGDVVIWDERFTLHSVVDDTKERRLLHRVTALGVAPTPAPTTVAWPAHEENTMASSGYFGIGGYEF